MQLLLMAIMSYIALRAPIWLVQDPYSIQDILTDYSD